MQDLTYTVQCIGHDYGGQPLRVGDLTNSVASTHTNSCKVSESSMFFMKKDTCLFFGVSHRSGTSTAMFVHTAANIFTNHSSGSLRR